MRINDEIMAKVRKKEQYEANLRRCLAVNICPMCGGTLNHKLFDDGVTNYRCMAATCVFTYAT